MKITHFANSFMSVEEANTRLLCDPWMGEANYGGWMSFPLTDKDAEILLNYPPTHIYISHLHADHLCDRVLKQLPHLDMPVIIKIFEDGRLRRRLQSIGFTNIIELPAWEAYRLSEDLEVTIIPADFSNASGIHDEIDYDLDTSILVSSLHDHTCFYNGVDNPMSVEQYQEVHDYVKAHSPRGKIDVACVAVGASSEYPQCFLNIDKQAEMDRVIDASLKIFEKQLDALGAEIYFPAGGSYFIPGKFSVLNTYIAQPSVEQLQQVVATSQHCQQLFAIEGGSSIDNESGAWRLNESKLQPYPTKESAIEAYKNFVYSYTNIPAIDMTELETQFKKARETYMSKLTSLSIAMNWRVIFHLYQDLQLDSAGNIVKEITPSKTFVLEEQENKRVEQELVCHLDLSLFTGLITRKCIWNISLSGSVIMFERTPNVFLPNVPFSLNYLVSLG